MCFDYDGYCDIYEESFPKARIAHTCVECGGTIPAGAVYQHIAMLFERRWETFKICHSCAVMRAIISITEIKCGCLSNYAPPVPELRYNRCDWKAFEPTEADLAVSLADWDKRISAALEDGREKRHATNAEIRGEMRV